MMKCLEVKVGVTKPSYHSAIRFSELRCAENRAHRPGSYWIALRAFSRIAFLETCKCVPVLSPDWRQHRSESQVDAFTCFGRILNLLEQLLLPDRIVECRNDLCSTGQISAQRHIQVAEFRCACLYAGPCAPLILRGDRETL